MAKIIRFRQNGPREVLASHLTIEEAQEHCNKPETSGDGWFDGYELEGDEDE